MNKSSNTDSEFWTPERCFIRELLNAATCPEVSLARTRVEPGVRTQLHSLSVLEWYVIEAGEGLMKVGDEPAYPVSAGDTVRIPVGTAQQITNTGTADLLFFCICVPRFTPDAYTALE